MSQLTMGQRSLLGFIAREANPEGWTFLSESLHSLAGTLPTELAELHHRRDGLVRAKLTEEGRIIAKWCGA